MIEPGILAGAVRDLGPGVRRITAPNPGVMTGAGTNTYLIGQTEVAVIDPGPADERHLRAVLAAGGGRIRWVLVTHTHFDHSPGAAWLRETTDAEVLGLPPLAGLQDLTFVPDRLLEDGEAVAVPGFPLRAMHTPGHASNHLCYLLESQGILFTGDHVKQDSTVVIAPPDGNMTDYVDSLRLLLSCPLAWLAPGHGLLMDRPHRVLERLIAHRLGREAKVMEMLQRLSGATAQELLPFVYDDVPPFLHRVAIHSLTAHLIKLRREGRASLEGELWGAAS